MKWMKKIATLALAIALVVPCFSMISHAANSIQFEDPSTAVGEKLDLLGVIKTDSGSIEDRTIIMSYDTTMLKFEQGDNVTETTPGELKYEVKGQQTSERRIEFHMSFTALKEGTTKVEVKSSKIYSTSDAELTYSQGSSTITIAPGNPVEIPTEEPAGETDTTVDVNGTAYTISEAFKEEDIPENFEETEFEYDGTTYKSITMPGSDLDVVYMKGQDTEGEFFIYNRENGAFYPFKYIEISELTSIVILEPEGNVSLPEPYAKTTLGYDGKDGYAYTVWVDTTAKSESKDNSTQTKRCVVYALNNLGEKTFYQFDTIEGTYQRFEVPTVLEEKQDTLIAKISNKLGSPMDLIVFGIGFLVILIIIIILSVKLYNRNAELDELYDEYGIDLFDDEEDEKKDKGVVRIEEEDEEEIDYGTEDDIVIEGFDEEDEAKDLVKEEPESQLEQLGGLEQISQEKPETMEEAMKNLAAAVQSHEDYWSEESDDDFEMSFIDLDD